MRTVTHNDAWQRFELVEDGAMGILRYSRHDRVLSLDHVGVPPAIEGRGIGGALTAAALKWARDGDLAVVPVCGFVRSYLDRNPEAAAGVAVRASGIGRS